MSKSTERKLNVKAVVGLLAIIVAIVVVIVLVVNMTGKGGEGSKGTSGKLNTETVLNANGSLNIKNGDDKIVLKIQSDLNYMEGAELVIPYVLVVNDVEYEGTYTFATGYSIHSEPNDVAYKVSFLGIEQGAVKVMVSEQEAEPQE